MSIRSTIYLSELGCGRWEMTEPEGCGRVLRLNTCREAFQLVTLEGVRYERGAHRYFRLSMVRNSATAVPTVENHSASAAPSTIHTYHDQSSVTMLIATSPDRRIMARKRRRTPFPYVPATSPSVSCQMRPLVSATMTTSKMNTTVASVAASSPSAKLAHAAGREMPAVRQRRMYSEERRARKVMPHAASGCEL